MRIMNNFAAQTALSELNKNTNRLKKDFKKISTGERLPDAGEGASDYSVSEKMRALVRALDQDIRNVQNGKALINIALGGTQDIIDELRALKELALNSCNDHNTDIDREILQKDFDARKAHIDSVATETNYNGIRLLDGSFKRLIAGKGIMEGERLVAQTTKRTVVTNPLETTTSNTSETKNTPPVTESKILSLTEESSETEVTPSVTASDPVITTSTDTETYRETSTKTLSSSKISTPPTESGDKNRRTVVTNDTVISKKVTSTSDVQRETTIDTTKVTTTEVAVEYVNEQRPTLPTIIKNGTTKITKDGVYEFAPDYTGTLDINAQNVQLQGPKGTTLNEVYITNNNTCNLYIKDLNIYNTKDQSTIDFYFRGTSTLHVLGENNIKTQTYPQYNTTKAIIQAGGMTVMGTTSGGLNIVGGGSLNLELYERGGAAKIGADAGNSCGDISIGQNVSIRIVKTKNGSAGAGIGCGGAGEQLGACGNITIGTNANIYIDMGPNNEDGTAAAAIGSGDIVGDNPALGTGCKDIIVYSGANIEVKAIAGAGIGTGCYTSMCGNIIVYSDAKVNAFSEYGAGIGSGWNKFDRTSVVGDITVYSYSSGNVVAASNHGESIGKGYDPRGNFAKVGSVNLTEDYNHTEGGILDLSEMELPVIDYEAWEVTTTVTEETETSETVTENRSVTNNYFEETENIITTSIYEHYAEKDPDKPGKPLVIHTGAKANQNLPVYIEDMRLDALKIKDTKINTPKDAKESLDVIDAALDYTLNEATTLGAYSNRLSLTESNLTAAEENTKTSESVIRDADMAKATANFARNSILAQSAQSMLAQANQNASSVISLLG